MCIRDRDVPRLGFGTFQLGGQACRDSVLTALDVGYRHIDTASMYGNEAEIGSALRETSVDRDTLFITTKVWHTDLAPDNLVASVERSLTLLGLDVLDNVLIHWPNPDIRVHSSLDALALCQQRGLIRGYGVSNFTLAQFQEAVNHDANISNHQVEHHAYLEQNALRRAVVEAGGFLTAYSPLGRGKLFSDPTVRAIASAHDVHPAQVAIAWLLSFDHVAVIPKATGRAHIESNFQARSLRLTQDELVAMDALPKNDRQVDPGFAPTWDPSTSTIDRSC